MHVHIIAAVFLLCSFNLAKHALGPNERIKGYLGVGELFLQGSNRPGKCGELGQKFKL